MGATVVLGRLGARRAPPLQPHTPAPPRGSRPGADTDLHRDFHAASAIPQGEKACYPTSVADIPGMVGGASGAHNG